MNPISLPPAGRETAAPFSQTSNSFASKSGEMIDQHIASWLRQMEGLLLGELGQSPTDGGSQCDAGTSSPETRPSADAVRRKSATTNAAPQFAFGVAHAVIPAEVPLDDKASGADAKVEDTVTAEPARPAAARLAQAAHAMVTSPQPAADAAQPDPPLPLPATQPDLTPSSADDFGSMTTPTGLAPVAAAAATPRQTTTMTGAEGATHPVAMASPATVPGLIPTAAPAPMLAPPATTAGLLNPLAAAAGLAGAVAAEAVTARGMAPNPVTAMRETTGVNLSLTTLSTGVAAQAAEPTPTDSTTPEAQTPQAPTRAEDPLGPRPSWQQRLIHLHGDGESVKVTIRDSQLDAKEASTVVYRLAGDLAAQGYRLREVMVNGRHVLRKGRSLGHQTAPLKADASGAQQTVAGSAQPIAITPSSTPLQESEHGA